MVKASGIRAWITRTFFYDLDWAWTCDTRPGRGRGFALQAVLTIAAIGALGAWPKKANTLIEAIDEADYWVTLGYRGASNRGPDIPGNAGRIPRRGKNR